MNAKNPNRVIRHGTAVLLPVAGYAPAAVFMRGPSGSGKSDLAFRLMAAGATLISDDQAELENRQGKIYAGAVDAIRGLIEVRGVGLLRYPVADPAPVRLVIDLVAQSEVPRLPEWGAVDILGVSLPLLRLWGLEASAPCKLQAAMMVVHKPEMIVK